MPLSDHLKSFCKVSRQFSNVISNKYVSKAITRVCRAGPSIAHCGVAPGAVAVKPRGGWGGGGRRVVTGRSRRSSRRGSLHNVHVGVQLQGSN